MRGVAGLVLMLAVMDVSGAPSGRAHSIVVGPGPEDFRLQANGPRGPRLLISTQDRLARPRPPGAIYAVDLEGDRRDVPILMPVIGHPAVGEFGPAGMSLVHDASGEALLYVINHGVTSGKAKVDRFRVDGDTLVYVDSLPPSPLVRTPNALVATPGGQVYLSNAGYGGDVADILTFLFRRRTGSVVRFDGAKWEPFIEAEFFPNGLALDPTGRFLFLNVFGRSRFEVWDTKSRATKPLASVPVPGSPDNLHWESPDHLDIAAHGSKLRSGLHSRRASIGAPSLVYRVDVSDPHAPKVGTAVKLPGFDAASTALFIGGRLYVSQLIGPRILVLERGTQ